MSWSATCRIGVVELPELGLFDSDGKNRASVRSGTALISKQVLLADLQAKGFDAQLVNLKQGHDQVECGSIRWGATDLTKVYLGTRLTDRRPVIVGGSDALADPYSYIAAGAAAVVLDKSGAANPQ